MKKRFALTKCTVKLRKSGYRNEWYLVLESYPVFDNGKTIRVIKSLNRIVTTPIWDKNRRSRTASDGTATFKPKRDMNGIIQCKSELDQEACNFADGIRKIRQKEFDNADLYSEKEAELKEKERLMQGDFVSYFQRIATERHSNSSRSIIVNWRRVHELLKAFSGEERLTFARITTKTAEDFRRYLFTAHYGGKREGTLSQNTAGTYFGIFKAGLRQAFIDGFLSIDVAAKIKGIQETESRREHLDIEELNILAKTPCRQEVIKRAALFSALTGLRHCDIQKLRWKEVQKENGGYRLNFTQKKTKSVEYMPISGQAYRLCGEAGEAEQLVFDGLPMTTNISKPLKSWIKSAGISRKITFHCFRHTYATLLLANGTDIYTVSKMLGHANVKTTQIYAKVVDKKKEAAANAINIEMGDFLDRSGG